MKLCLTSDLHGKLPQIPECDVLIIAGDIVPLNAHHPVRARQWFRSTFADWLASIPAKRVIAIAGNHDIIFQAATQLMPELPWTYLEDSGCEVEGLKVWGTPWQPRFFDWAFNLDEPELAERWQLIPDDTDILVVHGPPRGCGDWSTFGNEHCGSPSLRKRIEEVQPRLVVCGHIHGGYGRYSIGATTVLNVAHVNEDYRPVHLPVELVIEAVNTPTSCAITAPRM